MLHEDRSIIMDASNMCVHSALCLLNVCVFQREQELIASVCESLHSADTFAQYAKLGTSKCLLWASV